MMSTSYVVVFGTAGFPFLMKRGGTYRVRIKMCRLSMYVLLGKSYGGRRMRACEHVLTSSRALFAI